MPQSLRVAGLLPALVTVAALAISAAVPVTAEAARCGNWSQDVQDVKTRHVECSNAMRVLDQRYAVDTPCTNFFEPCRIKNYRCDGERVSATRAKGHCKRLTRKGSIRWDQVLSH